MRLMIVPIVVLAMMGAAQAQQSGADVASLQRLLGVLETQRNWALAQHAFAESRAVGLAEELTKAKAQCPVREPESRKPDAPAKEMP